MQSPDVPNYLKYMYRVYYVEQNVDESCPIAAFVLDFDAKDWVAKTPTTGGGFKIVPPKDQ